MQTSHCRPRRAGRRGRARALAAAFAAMALALLVAGPACTALKRRAYAPADRDAWQQPARVVEALALAPGDRVADLGAGGGYFTFRLADAVGPGGRVLAVDVDDGMLSALARDAGERGVAQVEVVHAAPDDARLAPASVDLVFTSNTYHHLQDRVAYFERLAAALAPGGRVAIVEFRESPSWVGGHHATSEEEIEREMTAAGYRRVARHDFLERQSFLVFERDGER